MTEPTDDEVAEQELVAEQERRRGEYLVNFGEKMVHQNPAWGDCNMDSVDSGEKATRSAVQLAEYKDLGYRLCKKCVPKQVWPRGE